jgi:hypothetical protein
MLPDAEQIRAALDYNPETGEFTFRPRGNQRFDGRFAGRRTFSTLDTDGYCQGQVLGAMRRANRVAWVHYHGEWPNGEVDHINGDRADNRITNLRCVSARENRRNQRPRRSIPLGVSRNRNGKRWRATIRADGVYQHLGTFDTVEEAQAARKVAEAALGFHPNHGCDVTTLRSEGQAQFGEAA